MRHNGIHSDASNRGPISLSLDNLRAFSRELDAHPGTTLFLLRACSTRSPPCFRYASAIAASVKNCISPAAGLAGEASRAMTRATMKSCFLPIVSVYSIFSENPPPPRLFVFVSDEHAISRLPVPSTGHVLLLVSASVFFRADLHRQLVLPLSAETSASIIRGNRIWPSAFSAMTIFVMAQTQR